MTNTNTITAECILKHLKISYKIPEVIQEIMTRQIIEEEAKSLNIVVEDEELQKMADQLRLVYQLNKAEDTWKWLNKYYLTLDDFEEIAYYTALSSKLGSHLFSHKIESYFYEHQLDYIGVALYEIIFNDRDLATELFYAIQEKEISFCDVAHQYIQDKELRRKGGYQGIVYRKDLKPEISAAVFAANPPQLLKPIITAQGIHLILVEELIEAKLDQHLSLKIVKSLFDDWLQQKKCEWNPILEVGD